MIGPPPARGWGVRDAHTGEIDMTTVSPTKRAAMVNWLWVSGHVPVTNAFTDDQIEQAFLSFVMSRHVEVCEVLVHAA